MDNKKLLYLLLGLGILYGLTQIFNKKKDRSFDSQFLKLDTATVNKIVLHAAADNQKELVLEKTNGTWTANQNGKKVEAEAGSVDAMIKDLASIQVKSILTESKDRHKEYEIEDEKGSRVEVYTGTKKLADFYVGKFGFNPQGNSMVSYIRKTGENKVFGVDGFQSMTFNQQFANFRDKTIVKLESKDITAINVTSGSSVHQLTKQGGGWLLNQKTFIDSAKAESFISGITSISGSELIDQFNPAAPIHQAKIESAGKVYELSIFPSGDSLKPFIIRSSQNADVYFKEDSNGVYNSVVKGMMELGIKK